MLAQGIVERGMLDGLANGVMRIKYAVESKLGEGNAKWLLLALMLLLLYWALRPRR